MIILVSLLFIVPGLLSLFFPAFGWYIRYGWMIEGDSEPSEAFIAMSRIGGGIAVFIGLLVLLTGGSILNY